MMLQMFNDVLTETRNNENNIKQKSLSDFLNEKDVPTRVGETINEQFKKYIKLQHEKNK